ncbi:hypothetical protein ERJ75_000036100 [Trypanosoma vivax]|uniref:RNA-editing substrate-binding complex 8 protein HEAT repeats domain-containing protein n=1 Tax=Trypanosoma vivax (strain Y486) TaxID=1055687 RepID=G0U7V0_TRYVY|nr:hypothetical protein TRVL_00412 [Trypanosoma vivax]KAH8620410.1 hypothetical protein ERJ75_000036100 [Trypanosoma vivax]CCC51958.1 conserved hypothetical protein [Trypanosoma vivax Y486]
MRCSVPQLRAGGLAALLNAVASRRVVLTSEDVYKMCSLLKAKEDTLSLRENYDFIRGIHAQYSEMDPETVSPFQRSFIDGTFATFPNLTASCSLPTSKGEECLPNHCTTQLAADGRGTMTREGAVGLTDGEPTVEQRIAAINELVQEFVSSNFVGSNGMQKVQKHCKALELQLRQMKPFEVVSLVRALSMIHYHDSTFTHLLARRSCEVASKLSASEICRTYYNLSKLQNHDSMVAFVNQIEAQLDKLHREQVQFVAMALERQTQIASAPSRMVPKLLSRGAAVLSEADSAVFHRSLLVVAARYSQNRHPAVAKIMANVSKHLDSISERDLLTVLQTVVDLGFSAASPGMTELLKKTATVAETAEIRNLDTLMDILSVLPVDTGDIMAKLLERLVLESGKLTVPQLAFTLDLLSTYPPARGHACIAALAFAASVRSASFDSETLEQAVLNLAQLQQFSDDFYSLATVLNNEKGGFRRFEKLIGVMKCCTPEVVADVRGQEMITKGILGLAPSLNDEELAETRKLLVHLGVDDKNVHQTIFRRAKQMQRSAGSRWASRGYDDAGSFL